MQNIDKELNKREKYKARLKPYDYFSEFESLDFESLGEGDRFYLQDFGIFNVDFLEDEFTIRIRSNGGKYTPQEFKLIADIVDKYDLRVVLTARAGIQLHDITAEDVLEIWKTLNSNNLTTWQSFGDNIRNIVTDVYDGVNKHSIIEVSPLIESMQEYIIKNPRYVGMLPRRVSIGISGNSANVNSFFANDIYFALAKKDNTYGFNVYMGGKNTEIAKDIDVFLKYDDVFDFFKAFVETFYKHGSRFSRSRTRLYYMIEEIGIEKLKELIQNEYKKDFSSAGTLELKHVVFEEFEELKNNLFAYCYQTNFANLTSKEIKEISEFALNNAVEIRLATDQNIYLIGLKEKKVPFKSPALSSTIVACAGNMCPYSAWSIKDETSYLPLEKIYSHKIKVGFSGCVKGCGRHRHVDIGLIGLKTNNFGDTDGGAKVFIGAEHDIGKNVARELFAMVPFVHLKDTLSLVIKLYEKSGYKNFQLYANNILNNYSQEFISLWHLLNIKTKQTLTLNKIDYQEDIEFEKKLLHDSFADFKLNDSFKNTISTISKELWTIEGKDPTYKPPIKRTNFR
jgi:ferredoxin-nitrite reductase